jgi:predicted lipoprotein
VVAGGVSSNLQALEQAWSPEQGDFSSALAQAGEASSPYLTQSDALTAVFHALFKIETSTKDRKLAHALGLRDCTTASCLDTLETPLAGGSVQWVLANVQGFDALLHGGDGAGLDDLLVERGHADVLDDLTTALAAVRAAAAEVQGPIDVAVESDRDDLLALHEAMVALTDVVKNELALVLMLEIPAEAAGDND